MSHQIPLPKSAIEDHPDHSVHEVLPDVAFVRTLFVNVIFLGHAGAADRQWLLADAGLPGFTTRIERAAERRFGRSRPFAILLTHGHFDHVGCVEELAEFWDVPVLAHRDELQFLDGASSYPPPNPHEHGLMARMSPMLPRGPIDLGTRVHGLPGDGTIPGLAEWRWIHVPGHTPGQVALWRERDRTLVSADAVITTAQESAYSAMFPSHRTEMHGPPQYFTPDWASAQRSVERLAELEPEIIVPGHGLAARGPQMRRALFELAGRFQAVAVPASVRHGGHVRVG